MQDKLRGLIGKVPQSHEEKNAAEMALIRKYAHEGMSDEDRKTIRTIKAMLADLGPLPHTDLEWQEADRILGALNR